jgi:ABC-2 type transport system permease protein
MTAFTQHFAFEFRTGVRNRTSLLMFYLFPLGFYLLAGALMTGVNPTFRDTLIPAMIFFTILTGALLGLPDPIIKAREAGIFRSYKIHGIPEFSILMIPLLTTLMHMVLVSVVIVLTAPLLFNAALPTDWFGFLLSVLLMLFASSGLGVLLGVVAPGAQAAVLLGQAVFLPSMLIGGLMFPTSFLPEALGKLALLLPTTHAMNLYNVFGRGLPYDLNPYLSTIVLYFGGALATGLAIYLFNWDSQNQTQRGHPRWALIALIPYLAALILGFVQ